MNYELWAPLPSTYEDAISEATYLQKEILMWNSKQSCPRLDKNCMMAPFTTLDEAIVVILDGRRTLIGMRQRWIESTFKRSNQTGWSL